MSELILFSGCTVGTFCCNSEFDCIVVLLSSLLTEISHDCVILPTVASNLLSSDGDNVKSDDWDSLSSGSWLFCSLLGIFVDSSHNKSEISGCLISDSAFWEDACHSNVSCSCSKVWMSGWIWGSCSSFSDKLSCELSSELSSILFC